MGIEPRLQVSPTLAKSLAGETESDQELSRLLMYLPGIYTPGPRAHAEAMFLGRFLRIFEALWATLEQQLGQLYAYFDPNLTPVDFLPWLGSWFALALDENWPIERRRALIHAASDLYARRGTEGALRDYLRLYLGLTPQEAERQILIQDEGQVEGQDIPPFHFIVTLRVAEPETLDRNRITHIIAQEKPAPTTYSLRILPL